MRRRRTPVRLTKRRPPGRRFASQARIDIPADLTSVGGGGIEIHGAHPTDFDAPDFLL